MGKLHFPRWEELPDLDLYMDQVIVLIERYLGFMKLDENDYIVTNTMINNYVKLNLLPKPKKKRYSKQHLAYLIAILSLKQVLSIQEIIDGIKYQAGFSGTRTAYNYFCDQQELAIHDVLCILGVKDGNINLEHINDESEVAIKLATRACASKIIATHRLHLQNKISRK
ncbi:MAG: DUF1836 domain-containing protein [Erysipelotrichaceae bacterium]